METITTGISLPYIFLTMLVADATASGVMQVSRHQPVRHGSAWWRRTPRASYFSRSWRSWYFDLDCFSVRCAALCFWLLLLVIFKLSVVAATKMVPTVCLVWVLYCHFLLSWLWPSERLVQVLVKPFHHGLGCYVLAYCLSNVVLT